MVRCDLGTSPLGALAAIICLSVPLGVLVVVDARLALAAGCVAASVAVLHVGTDRLLLSALAVRTLSDWEVLHDATAVDFASVNAVVSGFLIALAGVVVAGGRLNSTTRAWIAAAIGLLLASHLVGRSVYGGDPAIVREALRVAALLAAAVIACGTRRPDRLIRGMLVIGLLPVSVAVYEAAGGSRAAATLAHPNVAAVMFGLLSVLALAAAIKTSARSRRWYLCAAALTAVGTLATASFAGLGSLLLAASAVLVLSGRRVRGRFAIALIVPLVGIGTFVFSPLGQERLSELSSTRGYSEVAGASVGETTNSLDWRFYNWSQLMVDVRERPVFGHGLGSTSGPLQPAGNLPHNEYLRILAEGGIVGSLAVLYGCLRLWRGLRKRTATLPAQDAMVLASCGVLVFIGVNAMAANTVLYTVPMLFAASMIGAAMGARIQGTDSLNIDSPPSSAPLAREVAG